jgi:hypothetical protein
MLVKFSYDKDNDNNPEKLGIPLNLQVIDEENIILGGEYVPALYEGRIYKKGRTYSVTNQA